MALGLAVHGDERRWLVRGFAPATDAAGGLLLSLGNPSAARAAHGGASGAAVVIGDGPSRGRLWGSVSLRGVASPLERILLVGPGMHAIEVSRGGGPGPSEQSWVGQVWSRSMGALGGADSWRRLASLRVTVIGCGRSGSLVASALARSGVRRLTLVDADDVEPHCLGEVDLVTPADVGRAKVHALADRLVFPAGGEVRPLPVQAQARQALEAARDSDVLFVAADRDTARLCAAVVAALYHKVLFDVGTGIHGSGERRVMGTDVRLIIPDDGCLLCVGGLADRSRAVDELTLGVTPSPVPWNEQRAGSLQSLNRMAVALALRMLEDLVVGRIQRSTWVQCDFDAEGMPSFAFPRGAANAACELCPRAGEGDASGVGVSHAADEW
jgi:hypothetical protein